MRSAHEHFGILKPAITSMARTVAGRRRNYWKPPARLFGPWKKYAERANELAGAQKGFGYKLNQTNRGAYARTSGANLTGNEQRDFGESVSEFVQRESICCGNVPRPRDQPAADSHVSGFDVERP